MARVRTLPGDTVLEVQRSRQTGANVSVEYLPWADEQAPWQTTCWTHGSVCCHETRTLAESFARTPAGMDTGCCGQCAEDYNDRDRAAGMRRVNRRREANGLAPVDEGRE